MRRISVLLHERDKRERVKPYLLSACQEVWATRGIDVELLWGTDRPATGDVVISHVNLTRMPKRYVEFLERYPVVVNSQVRDVSKRTISSHLVTVDESYNGPVIIKTNRNAGGLRELRALGSSGPLAPFLAVKGRVRHRLVQRSARYRPALLAWAATLSPSHYPVFSSIRDVPRAVFDNKDLVVERYLPEVEGKYYCLRSYCFLGDRSITVKIKSIHPVVKAGSIVQREEVPVAESIVAARHELGFDYGKFDYVEHDGKAVLLDANPTPVLAGTERTPGQCRVAGLLADGISCWDSGVRA